MFGSRMQNWIVGLGYIAYVVRKNNLTDSVTLNALSSV